MCQEVKLRYAKMCQCEFEKTFSPSTVMVWGGHSCGYWDILLTTTVVNGTYCFYEQKTAV